MNKVLSSVFVLIFLIISLSSCNKDLNKCERKNVRMQKKCPELFVQKDTVIQIDTIIEGFIHDTTIQTIHDTSEVIKIVNQFVELKDTLWLTKRIIEYTNSKCFESPVSYEKNGVKLTLWNEGGQIKHKIEVEDKNITVKGNVTTKAIEKVKVVNKPFYKDQWFWLFVLMILIFVGLIIIKR